MARREFEVDSDVLLDLISDGFTHKEMAEHLGCSRPTLEKKIARLLVELPLELMARLKGFVARSKVNYPWEYYIIQLLTEALDHRGYQLRPGQGRGRVANTDIDLHPLALDLSHVDEEQ